MPARFRKWSFCTWVVVLLLFGACERPLPGEPVVDSGAGEERGTFAAEAGVRNEGGYQRMEGPATFEVLRTVAGRSVFVLRLHTTSGQASSVLDFALLAPTVPAPGVLPVGDATDPRVDLSTRFVASFSSPVFGAPYASESGRITFTAFDEAHAKGSFEVTVFTLEQVGPDAYVRRRLPLKGTFHAVPGVTGVNPDALLPGGS